MTPIPTRRARRMPSPAPGTGRTTFARTSGRLLLASLAWWMLEGCSSSHQTYSLNGSGGSSGQAGSHGGGGHGAEGSGGTTTGGTGGTHGSGGAEASGGVGGSEATGGSGSDSGAGGGGHPGSGGDSSSGGDAGSGGDSGGAGTAAVGGSQGTGGATTAGADSAGAGGEGGAGECGCLTTELSWGFYGPAIVHHRDYGSLSGCGSFELRRDYLLTTDPDRVCTSELDQCGTPLGVPTLLEALSHPDVEQAILLAPIQYGHRFATSSVQRIQIGEARIEIAQPCGSLPDCLETPAGLLALRELLLELLQEQQLAEDCAAILAP